MSVKIKNCLIRQFNNVLKPNNVKKKIIKLTINNT